VAVGRPAALKLTAKFPRQAKLKAFLNGRLRGRVSCSRSCTVDISARLPRKVAKKLKAPVVVGRAHIVISGNRARVVRIRVVKKARNVLAQSRGFVVTVSTGARGAVGGVSRKAPTLRITR
jgi:hypothetical protein